MQNIRWKVITIVAVFVIFFTVGVYPILGTWKNLPMPGWLKEKQLKLGLDLKGGVHLVLRVHTDDALRLETETEMERLREQLRTKSITFANIKSPDPTHFVVEGIQPAQEAPFRTAANEVQANFDRGSGVGGTYTFAMKPNVQLN